MQYVKKTKQPNTCSCGDSVIKTHQIGNFSEKVRQTQLVSGLLGTLLGMTMSNVTEPSADIGWTGALVALICALHRELLVIG